MFAALGGTAPDVAPTGVQRIHCLLGILQCGLLSRCLYMRPDLCSCYLSKACAHAVLGAASCSGGLCSPRLDLHNQSPVALAGRQRRGSGQEWEELHTPCAAEQAVATMAPAETRAGDITILWTQLPNGSKTCKSEFVKVAGCVDPLTATVAVSQGAGVSLS